MGSNKKATKDTTKSSQDNGNNEKTLFFKNPSYAALAESRRKKSKNLKQITELMQQKYGSDTRYQQFNYYSVSVPPAMRPRNKYCDVTGLPTNYTDPKTGLRYYSAAVYQYVRSLSPDQVQQYLKLRNAHTTVK